MKRIDLSAINQPGCWLRVGRHDDGSFTLTGVFPGDVHKVVHLTAATGLELIRHSTFRLDMTATIPAAHLDYAQTHHRTEVLVQMDRVNPHYREFIFPMWPGAMHDLLIVNALDLADAMGITVRNLLGM